MNILVTGGAGYIGSITCVQLIAAGFRPVILDSLVNAKAAVVDRMEQVARQRPVFIEADVRDHDRVVHVLREHDINAVIHFAGLKAVGESVAQPLRYYDNNVQGSLVLIDAMRKVGVKTLVFSSSATVYGEAQDLPLHEDLPMRAISAVRCCNPGGAPPIGWLGDAP